MIFSSVDLPEPFRPSTPIFAPGKKDSETPLRICRFGGTILPTRFIVNTYWAMGVRLPVCGVAKNSVLSPQLPSAVSRPRASGRQPTDGRSGPTSGVPHQ